MQKLLQLIEKLYGKKALSKTLGTRTNVITLSDNETKRFIKDELNIEAASETAVQAAKDRAEKLIADIPKMNDQEILTFTNNLQRMDNVLNPPKAEMFDITTKKPISKEGIAQLETEFGLPEGVDEGSIMGQLTRAAQRVREQAKTVPGIQEGEKLQTGVMRSAVRYKMLDDLEKGILKVSEEEAAIIKGEAKGDPLDLWLENYGPDAMEAIQEMEPALRKGTTPKDLLLTIEKNVDARPLTETEKLEMKANTREAGRVMQDVEEGKVTDKVTEAYIDAVRKGKFKGTEDQFRDLIDRMNDEFAEGGRVGLKGGGDVPVITIEDKIDEMISFYKDYLKKGGKMDFVTFSRKYIPENFAKGGRVGYEDGGILSLEEAKKLNPGMFVDTTTYNPIPENAPNMAADEIAKVIMGTLGMDDDMSSRTFVFEEYVVPKRKELMENFGLTMKEADDLIREGMAKYRTNKAIGGRVGFQKGTSKIFEQLEMDVPHPYGHRVNYQIGGLAYDATDHIYGAIAITVTPDTIMRPQCNQIQAQMGKPSMTSQFFSGPAFDKYSAERTRAYTQSPSRLQYNLDANKAAGQFIQDKSKEMFGDNIFGKSVGILGTAASVPLAAAITPFHEAAQVVAEGRMKPVSPYSGDVANFTRAFLYEKPL